MPSAGGGADPALFRVALRRRRTTRRRHRISRRRPGFRASAASTACSCFVLIRRRSQARAKRTPTKKPTVSGKELMDYRNLGSGGVKVSPLCLGTMMFGGATDEATAGRIVAKAREQGVNFIDSADAYNGGKSEEIAGRAIGNQRHDWVVATKLANPMGEGANRGGLSRKWVMQAAEESLRRLGTDYIDIYYLHKEDHATPLAETVRAVGDLLRQGKIRYFGVSNYKSWRVAEICNLCDRMGIDRPIVSQPYYHALYRVAESRAPAGLRELRPRRGELLAARARRAHRQVPAGRGSREGHARGPRRQAHAADRISSRDAGGGAEGEGLCREARRRAQSLRGRLGAEQQTDQRRGGGSAHRGAMGRLREGARFQVHQGRRGVHQRSRRHRPCGGAGLQRSGLSDRGPRGADIG